MICRSIYQKIFAVVSSVIMIGCSVMPDIRDNHLKHPELNFFEYFARDVTGSGFLRNWRGQITRQFTVSMRGYYLDESHTQLRIEESFVFDNGEAQQRIWTLSKSGDQSFTGTAADTIGGASGRQQGNAVNWRYRLSIPYKSKSIAINFDDWLYLQEDGQLLNAVKMKKFGLTVGTLFIAFQPVNS